MVTKNEEYIPWSTRCLKCMSQCTDPQGFFMFNCLLANTTVNSYGQLLLQCLYLEFVCIAKSAVYVCCQCTVYCKSKVRIYKKYHKCMSPRRSPNSDDWRKSLHSAYSVLYIGHNNNIKCTCTRTILEAIIPLSFPRGLGRVSIQKNP